LQEALWTSRPVGGGSEELLRCLRLLLDLLKQGRAALGLLPDRGLERMAKELSSD
jgi:hypothetical protein